mgnify:FL=1|uniref:hypothetical protein n=1 Tax=Candidatus Ventrenecus sp. TaxID=3085654 RepID=UPI003FEF7223
MKKKILIILMAIVVGAVLALPTLSMASKDSSKKENMFVLQLGIFKNYDNAFEKKQSVKGSIIYQNKDVYYVLAGISKEETSLYKIEEYLKKENISYYKKQMIISYDADNLEKYNLLLQKTSDVETIKTLNEKVLKEVVKNEL